MYKETCWMDAVISIIVSLPVECLWPVGLDKVPHDVKKAVILRPGFAYMACEALEITIVFTL